MNDEVVKRIDWVYSAQNNQDLIERYNKWAKDYDADLIDALGRILDEDPSIALLVKYVPKTAKILDAGAGTGLIGTQLYHLGYHNLVAMDISTGMLAKAKEKKVYQSLHHMVLGKSLDFPSNFFDAIIACGVFTYGHAPASSFDELIRITKSGSYITFTIRPEFYEQSKFKGACSTLEANKRWQLIEVGEPYQALPETEPDLYLQGWIYQIS